MATRLSVITTRGGDQGTTGLGDGTRVAKNTPRIDALGDVDELNSVIGLWRCEDLPEAIDALLGRIQNDLFDLGAELCIPGHVALKEEHVLFLEEALARHNADLGKLREFILPGGTRAAAMAHLARTVCRRAERTVVGLEANRPVVQYLNRLSDLCFVLARALNKHAGRGDVLWQRD
ncbi:cob(I)yrinic acid a,c-diamide adenosyltransferase [Parapusillimonas granuli]|uniref:Cobalamin adenosyltransferase n=1 Tax=Parapusillimonas granuli TaxID=380911 RepID=A0A853G584_9BURK|nr:cob(I)yrinic acid a,c-diamide adenosyltransferase [Parapusillimonas granuli]MBB5215462.1 cob(I)alamin adenosyltransferase [Parapusillimonas granuli]MEB2400299.1 cob(I)yrinic acid a,c-diamide adenosyltransferase [Alcaligenaceae bacterium]NYT49871.1 cob(I)yrinic acid a,c-diamide adenosyltransferase [Parapusillimonas granuli]